MKRRTSVDIAKGIGIILVVLLHSLEMGMFSPSFHDVSFARIDFQFWKIVSSFVLPLFFIISGFVFTTKTIKSAFLDFFRLAFIAWVSGASVLIVKAACYQIDVQSAARSAIASLLTLGSFESVSVWFLVSIGIVRLAHAVFIRGDAIVRGMVLYGLVSAFFMGRSVEWWQFGTLLPGFIFFGLGRLLSIMNIENFLHGPRGVFAAFGLASVTISTAYLNKGCMFSYSKECFDFKEGFAVKMILSQFGFLPLFFLTAITGSLCIIAVSTAIEGFDALRLNKILAFCGRHSLALLVINAYFLTLFQPYVMRLANNISVPETVNFLVACLLVASQLILLRTYVLGTNFSIKSKPL